MGPELRRIDKCGGCGAPIIWATSAATGGRMPVDAEPSPKGNLLLVLTIDRKWVAIVMGQATREAGQSKPGERHTSHFATCPHASRYRKPVKTGGRK